MASVGPPSRAQSSAGVEPSYPHTAVDVNRHRGLLRGPAGWTTATWARRLAETMRERQGRRLLRALRVIAGALVVATPSMFAAPSAAGPSVVQQHLLAAIQGARSPLEGAYRIAARRAGPGFGQPLRILRANMDAAQRSLQALEGGGPDRILRAAEGAIGASERLPKQVSAGSRHLARENLATAGTLLNVADRPHDLTRAVMLAEAVGEALVSGGAPNDRVPPDMPSGGEAHLTATDPVAGDQARLLTILDVVPPDLRPSIGDVLSAFASYDSVARAAFPEARRAGYLEVEEAALRRLLAARRALLDAALELARSVGRSPPPQLAAPVQVSPLFSIDLTASDNTYTQDFRLLIDLGGRDTYLNNAGGNGFAGCPFPPPVGAAALIDLGGSDSYSSRRSCGVNGGGISGAGFLFDAEGDDIYAADGAGVNGGGAFGGLGLLVDGGGMDAYTSSVWGTNGAGFEGGIGLLVDGNGNDTYSGGDVAVNGGAWQGKGFLIDGGGDDTYRAGMAGTNGGGARAQSPIGSGFLLDAGGNDIYFAGDVGTNGGGGGFNFSAGVGFLLDAGGSDRYTGGESGTNGGAMQGGIGLLIDGGGIDTYTATRFGTNGGGWAGGAGFLLDGGGSDSYFGFGTNPRNLLVESLGTNGGGASLGAGFLLDGGGDDSYRGVNNGTNGGGLTGIGALIDAGGNDSYSSTEGIGANGGAMGGAEFVGVGFLADLSGDDSYASGSFGTNGGAGAFQGSHRAVALLFDGGGTDRFTAGDGGTNGGAFGTAAALLLNLDGGDAYSAGSASTNGGADAGGTGALIDLRGNDDYTAGSFSTNGGGRFGSKALLLDGGGRDNYQDASDPSGTGIDRTVFPKGDLGAQIDLPGPP